MEEGERLEPNEDAVRRRAPNSDVAGRAARDDDVGTPRARHADAPRSKADLPPQPTAVRAPRTRLLRPCGSGEQRTQGHPADRPSQGLNPAFVHTRRIRASG